MITHEFYKTKVKIILFFNQNKHKTPYYTPIYFSSDDEDFYDQNHQQF